MNLSMDQATQDPQALMQRIYELQQRVKELESQIAQQEKSVASTTRAGNSPAPESPVEIAPIQDGEATLRRLVQRIAMILQAEKVAIMFYDTEQGMLIAIPPAYGIDEDRLAIFRVRATEGVSGQVFRTGEPVMFHQAENDDRTKKDLVGLLHVSNGISVPLVIEKRDEENRVIDRQSIGVLHAFNKRHGDDFIDEDVRLLERMAKNVGSIIANLQLYRQVVEEREELLQTFESLTSGLILVSPEGKLSQINASARKIFGLENDSIGKHFESTTIIADVKTYFTQGINGEEPGNIDVQVEIAGQERSYQVQGALVANEEGKNLGFVTILNDVTEQRNLDRMKSSFVAMASHELRTPLTAIKGFSQTLLEDDSFSREEQVEFLDIIVNECDRLRRLIDDLLNTARIEANESLKPDYGIVEIRHLVEKVVTVQKQASHKHHVFHKIADNLPATIKGDKDKLDQIFTNLLNNAIKYSPEGGDVIVHAMRDGDFCEFWIQDHGIGIPADHLGKVFEKFHRVNNEDNRKIYGTGLGLFLVKHLVEEVHDGKIWVESEVGQGSYFKFRIPVDLDIEKMKERD